MMTTSSEPCVSPREQGWYSYSVRRCIAVRRKFLLRNVLPFFCSVAKTGSNASQNISLSLLESAVLTRDRIRSVRTLDVLVGY